MARMLKLEFSGAIYNVISCGDRKEPILNDDRDRRKFTESLPWRSMFKKNLAGSCTMPDEVSLSLGCGNPTSQSVRRDDVVSGNPLTLGSFVVLAQL